MKRGSEVEVEKMAGRLGKAQCIDGAMFKDGCWWCDLASGDMFRVTVPPKTPLWVKTKKNMAMGGLASDGFVLVVIDALLKQLPWITYYEQKLQEMVEKSGVKVSLLGNSYADNLILGVKIARCWIHYTSGSICNDEEDHPQELVSLPDHLITDFILSKLPVKSLLRFKSVSKYWYSTISTSEFAKLHLASSVSRHKFLILVRDVHVIVDDPNFRIFRSAFKHGFSRIIGSSNGLVGFSSFFTPRPVLSPSFVSFFVLNPATGRRVEIPYDDDLLSNAEHWFGYISSVDDYMIAAFAHDFEAFWTFSWRSGRWTKIITTQPGMCFLPFERKISHPPTLVKDSIYWPIDVTGVTDFSRYCRADVCRDIVKFNLVTKEYEVMPRLTSAFWLSKIEYFNFGGCLALHATSKWYTTAKHHSLDVWILREEDDWNSWEKIYSKVLRDVEVLYFSSTGKLVVNHLGMVKVVDDLSQVQLVDESRGDPEGIDSNSFGKDFKVGGDYVESLFAPF